MKFRSVFKKSFAIIAGATLLSAVAVHDTSAQVRVSAKKATVSGSIGKGHTGWKVFLVSPKGKTKISVVSSTGAFQFKNVARSLVKNATLQVVDESNRYAGPIVLAKEKIGDTTCAHTKLSGASMTGRVFKAKAGGFVAKKNASKTQISVKAVKASDNGVPLGATTGGVRIMTRAEKRACADAALGTKDTVGAESISAFEDPVTSFDLGEDLDSDGVPNTFDADDDGDKQVDAVDDDTQASAALNPWVSTRSNDPTFNADINGSLREEDIARVLGDPAHSNDYVIQFFVGNRNFTSTTEDVDATINDVRWMYVDCGELVYCGGDSPTAIDTMTHNSGAGVAWIDYRGGWNVEREGMSPSPTLDGEALGVLPDGTGRGNALWAMNRPSGDVERIYWRAAIFPNQGGDTIANVRPGDVFTLNYSLKGVLTRLAMMLNPHAVTVPGITAINGATYVGAPIMMPMDNQLALEFYRPQRLTAPGEIGGGVDKNFMDMGGLQYGLSLMTMDHNGFSCPASSFTLPDGSDLEKQSSDTSGVGWPLIDTKAGDVASDAANDRITFTVDLEACIKSAEEWDNAQQQMVNWGNDFWNTGGPFEFELAGAGTQLTGGSNVTSLQLTVFTGP